MNFNRRVEKGNNDTSNFSIFHKLLFIAMQSESNYLDHTKVLHC